jgi:hypothetical protein
MVVMHGCQSIAELIRELISMRWVPDTLEGFESAPKTHPRTADGLIRYRPITLP